MPAEPGPGSRARRVEKKTPAARSSSRSAAGSRSGERDGPRKSAQDWVRAALRALAEGSISAVKVERLAKELGVTKGSFYWHFADRDALLEAMRQEWVRFDTENVIALVDSQGESSDPATALETLLTVTLGPQHELDGVEAAMREWSAGDRATAAVCSMVDERRLDYVAGLLEAGGLERAVAERRAGVIYRMVIGEYVWRRYGGAPVDLETVLRVAEFLGRP